MNLTAKQLAWAQKIVARIRSRKYVGDDGTFAERIADITLATALVESGLKMYANGNNPASMKLPHDAVGWDHGSVGLFQQQVGGAKNSTANWGTTAQLMDVNTSTDRFVNALLRLDWLHMTNGAAAQHVQGSAFPDRYAQMDAYAVLLRKALWTAKPAPAPAPAPATTGHPVPFTPQEVTVPTKFVTVPFKTNQKIDGTPRYLLYGDKGYVTLATGPCDVISGTVYVRIQTGTPSYTPDASFQVVPVIDTVDATGKKVIRSVSLGTDEFPRSSGQTMHQTPVPPVRLQKGERLRVKVLATDGLAGVVVVSDFRGVTQG